ncbi:MAG: hypothetical protein HY898_29155 [Deltaproteobacteria bacterium]|nr:hypothetical protein [Deltaproteobacteria bacterium]
MKPREKLPWEIIWQHDGHVTDVVLTSMADGEEAIVPEVALDHVGGCDSCSRRLGDAALLSIRVDDHIVAAAAQARAARPRFPWAAVMVALTVAGLGMIPTLLRAPAWLAATSATLVQGLPLYVRSGALMARTLPQGLQGTLLVSSFVSAFVLTLTGYGIARAMTRSRSLQEGGTR